jgi:hypothetical protein
MHVGNGMPERQACPQHAPGFPKSHWVPSASHIAILVDVEIAVLVVVVVVVVVLEVVEVVEVVEVLVDAVFVFWFDRVKLASILRTKQLTWSHLTYRRSGNSNTQRVRFDAQTFASLGEHR